MSIRVIHGDCLEAMAAMEPDSIDACVCDPPYHLTSIVKRFGGANAAPAKFGIDGAFARASKGFMSQTWDGGDIAFRPTTWAAVARVLKPGGHLLAFGAPKNFGFMQVAIDAAGFEVRDCIAWVFSNGFPKSHNLPGGWGTALKPAYEPIILARKPLAEKTVAAQVLATGTGAINIGACRVGREERVSATGGMARKGGAVGRWPANLIHDGSDEVLAEFAKYGQSKSGADKGVRGVGGIWSQSSGIPCGPQHGDSGTAARFYYCAKAAAAERAGSKHPTVKPLALMRHLVRLVTPPGGVVLDPFAGSGTTGVACLAEGFNAILVEQSAEYVADIHRRLADGPLFAARAK